MFSKGLCIIRNEVCGVIPSSRMIMVFIMVILCYFVFTKALILITVIVLTNRLTVFAPINAQ